MPRGGKREGKKRKSNSKKKIFIKKKIIITAEAEAKLRSRCRKMSFKCSKEMKEWQIRLVDMKNTLWREPAEAGKEDRNMCSSR